MNIIFFALILLAFVATAWRQLVWIAPAEGGPGPMQQLTTAMIDSAGGSVTLALGLVGVMTFFLGLMKVAEKGGLLTVLAKLIRPLMVRLFPEVPPDHPAMGAMILNISANALGLGNAATPFGIRAMQELDKLNPYKGVATNAMALFLAINTSSVTLLPTGVIALRAAYGSQNPAAILPTTLFATICSTAAAILTALYLQRRTPFTPLE
ncbi:MAG: spore maturation protein, partial [Magnetococcales bacterium]|nr:spore maturation protein [Magnetococcales bacterium]